MSYWGDRKPEFGTRIDWNHPLAYHLAFSLVMNERGGNLQDTVMTNPDVTNFGALWQPEGLAFTAASSHYLAYPTGVAPLVGSSGSGTGTWSFAIRANPVAESTRRCLWSQRGNSSPFNSVRMVANATNAQSGVTSGRLVCSTFDGSWQECGATGVVDGRMHTFHVNQLSDRRRIYTDGVYSDAALVASGNILSSGTDRQMAFGRVALSATPEYYNNIIDFAFGWNRDLSVEEIAWLHAEPYAMFEAPEMPVFYSIPTGVTFNPAWALNSNNILYHHA